MDVLRQFREHAWDVLFASMAVNLFYGFLALITFSPEPEIAGLIVTAALWACVGLGSLNRKERHGALEPDMGPPA